MQKVRNQQAWVLGSTFLILLVITLIACTKDNPPIDNSKKPILLSPADGTIDQPSTIMLYWEKSGEKENPSFSINFGLSNPPDLFLENTEDTITTIYNLNKNTTYYWSVMEHQDGKTTESNVFSFTTTDNPKILPLKTGNQWFYKYSAYDSNGSVTDSSSSILILGGDTLINNDICFRYGNMLLTEKTEGIFQYYTTTPYLLFKYPASLSDNYFHAPGNRVGLVMSTNMSITVPAGTFSCYVYLLDFPLTATHLEYRYYVSPGIGIIKSELYLRTLTNKLVLSSSTDLTLFVLK